MDSESVVSIDDVSERLKSNLRLSNTIIKFESNLKKTNKSRITRGYLAARLDMLMNYWKTFETTHHLIMSNMTEEDERTTDYCVKQTYDIIEEVYLNAITFINDKKDEICPPTPQPNFPTTNQNSNEISTVAAPLVPGLKLPAITIPKFDGSYQSWPAFYDLFTSLVHDNMSIAQVHKLHYLKSCITGEADHLLRHFQVTNLNYAPAWEMLVQRYENKRILVNTVVKSLFNQPRLTTDTANAIKQLLDGTVECLHSLNNLGVDTNHWDVLIIYIVVQRLTQETHLLWEQSLESSRELPTFKQLQEFLEGRYRTLELVSSKPTQPYQRSASNTKKKTQAYHGSTTSAAQCILCTKDHHMRQCVQFTSLALPARLELVTAKKLCTNCLSPKHTCSKCLSKHRCFICKKRHHTLLHKHENDQHSDARVVNSSVSDNSPIPGTSTATSTQHGSTDINSFHVNNGWQSGQVLLATAIVRVTSDAGREYLLRALLDQGSQSSFITESASQLLGLKRERVTATISGIGEGQTTSSNLVNIRINAHFQTKLNLSVKALVLRSLTQVLPSSNLRLTAWKHIADLTLADPNFSHSTKIDLILGADTYADVLLEGIRRGPAGTPVAQKTQLGWILSGTSSNTTLTSAYSVSLISNVQLDHQLKRFWEVEEISRHRVLTEEEKYCEEQFEKTFSRNEDGRCIVKLPFKSNFDNSTLGRSKHAALHRFHQIEKSFRAKPVFAEQYRLCIKEYLDLNHMEQVPEQEESLMVRNNNNIVGYKGCYLPHHGVTKESSSTTKLRVVFDASQTTSTGVSLNDVLLTGPRLQDDLITIISRWRKFRIAVTADIEKMYRQVLVHKEDADYQRVLWRNTATSQVQVYRLRTLTFGTTSAPYLAVKTMQHISKLEQCKYPLAALAINNNFYVDDLLSGADEVSAAISTQRQLVALLGSAGFELRKWTSNSDEFLKTIPVEHQETKFPLHISEETSVKTLGLYWHPTLDVFQFKICMSPVPETITKRRILSDVAKVFDPSGWLSPVTITAKIILQSLWLTGLEWDDRLPEPLTSTWIKYREQLKVVETISINRWIGTTERTKSIQLHCFCDASEQAYAAAVYLRVEDSEDISTHLLAAKTKVAPIKQISLARLELCGAVLGARLLNRMKMDLRLVDVQLFAWTDSTIVLAWLKGHPQRWSTFIANRVVEIHENIPTSAWNHISGLDNPADCASRGISPSMLQHHKLWWKGPGWLIQNISCWPIQTQIESTEEELRRPHIKVTVATSSSAADIIDRFSTWTRAIRCFAYCLRFLSNCKSKAKRQNGWLSTTELHHSTQFIIQRVQGTNFPLEIERLTKNTTLPSNSKLLNVTPFIDKDGVMRVGGRLQKSNLAYNAKHPIIMPKHHHCTTLLINHYHILTQHGGPQVTMNIIRQQYWIMDARNTIRRQIHKCIKCHRQKAIVHQQLMGQLPVARITSSRPFLHTGVDYAGPIDIKWNKGRGAKSYKAYIALFVCLAVKCIHLELVTELTTNGFIAAYRRFTARRGLCSDIYSDCGTNFVGAAKQLNKDFDRCKIDHHMAEVLANDNCKWHFIPPGSPNFGGLWEAGVKSTKFHLKRVMGNTLFTYEEMATCLNQIEAVLNSRPLCPLTNDPSDLNALTPGHFLIGDVLVTPPEQNFIDLKTNTLSRWQNIQQTFQCFWKRWHLEYLSNLQQRPKWLTKNKNIEVNDLVLVKDDRLPPSKWLLGRIISTTVGPDNLVRVAAVKTKNGTTSRAISKLCILPLEHSAHI